MLSKNNCPAYGKQCHGCLKWNHLKLVATRNDKGRSKTNSLNPRSEQSKRNEQTKPSLGRGRRINNLNEGNVESSSEEEYVYSTLTVCTMSYQKPPKFTIRINETPIDVMADTGASVNILDEVAFAKLRTKPKLNKTNEKIFPYGSNKPLPLVGKCKRKVETEKKFSVETFFIVNNKKKVFIEISQNNRPSLH